MCDGLVFILRELAGRSLEHGSRLHGAGGGRLVGLVRGGGAHVQHCAGGRGGGRGGEERGGGGGVGGGGRGLS